MENLDFEDKTPNEILEQLAQATEWLRDQYTLAKPLLPDSIVTLSGLGDSQASFFLDANSKHLPVLINSTRHVKSPEKTVQIISTDGTVYQSL